MKTKLWLFCDFIDCGHIHHSDVNHVYAVGGMGSEVDILANMFVIIGWLTDINSWLSIVLMYNNIKLMWLTH